MVWGHRTPADRSLAIRVELKAAGKPPPAETTGVQADGARLELFGEFQVTPATQPIEDCACGFGNHEQDRFLADAAREPAGDRRNSESKPLHGKSLVGALGSREKPSARADPDDLDQQHGL